jgi:hypothetical protein
MEETNETPQEETHLSDNEVFTLIWTSPRKVFRFINENGYERYMILLLILAGISHAFDRASMKDLGDRFSLPALIGFCVIGGGLFGWISFYISAWLINITGNWIKGKASYSATLRMIAYAMIPSIAALAFLFIQISVYGIATFQSDGDITGGGILANIIFYFSMFLEFVMGMWTLALFVIGLSEVQQFSIGKALLNLLLTVLLIIVPVIMLVLVIDAIR